MGQINNFRLAPEPRAVDPKKGNCTHLVSVPMGSCDPMQNHGVQDVVHFFDLPGNLQDTVVRLTFMGKEPAIFFQLLACKPVSTVCSKD